MIATYRMSSNSLFLTCYGLLSDEMLVALDRRSRGLEILPEQLEHLERATEALLDKAILAIEDIESSGVHGETVERIEVFEIIRDSLPEPMLFEQLKKYLSMLKVDCETFSKGKPDPEGHQRLKDFFTRISRWTSKEHTRMS